MSTNTKDILTGELRTSLKELFAKELKHLPGYIERLEPKDKLDYLLKIAPYVLPKVSSVEHDLDEPAHW